MIRRLTSVDWPALVARGRALCTRENFQAVDAWLARYGVYILLAFALLYYGQYYRSGLNFGGEGGTAGVIALRLMEGQRPIVDTFLGYNVMWFYPIVGLFYLFGPDYVALRLFFFAICTLGGILAFLTVRRSTHSGLYALLVSSLVILIPGMLFRNYMPFLGLVNMYCLLQAYVFAQPSRRRTALWMVVAGAVLGMTYLFRIELGFFFSIITLGLAVLYPLGVRGQFIRRIPLAKFGVLAAVVMSLLVHLPVYLDAKARGFDQAFLNQYKDWYGLVSTGLKQQLGLHPAKKQKAEVAGQPAPASSSPAPVVQQEAAPVVDKNVLQRPPISDAWKLPRFYDRAFVIISYLPVLVSVLVLGVGGVVFFVSLCRKWPESREVSLTLLTALGCSLTLYPQFLFFRPDTPHLSEFMAPFLVTLGLVIWHSARVLPRYPAWPVRAFLVSLILLCGVSIGLYFYHTMPKESGGTIAAKKKRNVRFQALNGVDVYLSKKEIGDYQAIFDAIVQNSERGDYVVCYPYAPTINFMTDRPSYEHNQYVDNATSSSKFHRDTLAEIDKYQPAVIVIDNRDINQSDSSRFAVWAAETYRYIQENYRHLGTYRRQEIYVRKTP